jgi:plasmid stabilization system protein ParE
MNRHVLSPAARLDMLQIWHYLCDNGSIQKADSVTKKIEDAFDLLATPRHGTRPARPGG